MTHYNKNIKRQHKHYMTYKEMMGCSTHKVPCLLISSNMELFLAYY